MNREEKEEEVKKWERGVGGERRIRNRTIIGQTETDKTDIKLRESERERDRNREASVLKT